MVQFLYSRTRLLSAGVLLLSISLLAGCSSGAGDKTGTVSGTVKVDTVTANSGTVEFIVKTGDKEGLPVKANIEPDGTYKAVGVPVGSATVTVTGPAAQGATGNAPVPTTSGMPGSAAGGKPVPIPAKYSNAKTSNLTYTVKGGTNNTYPIELIAK